MYRLNANPNIHILKVKVPFFQLHNCLACKDISNNIKMVLFLQTPLFKNKFYDHFLHFDTFTLSTITYGQRSSNAVIVA